MADLFSGLSGLGGLMKGLSSFTPQDDPDTKIFNATNELNELQQRELQLYAEIGRKMIPSVRDRPEFAAIINELNENQKKQVQIKEKLRAAEEEKKEKKRKEKEQLEARTCPNCSFVNPEGSKFCQECGEKLGTLSKSICPKCGTENSPQSRFCSECGNKL